MLRDSSFSLEDRKRYFIKKWKRGHRYSFVIPAAAAIVVIIVSPLLDSPAGVILGRFLQIPARIAAYNVMMTYVESRVFSENRDISKK